MNNFIRITSYSGIFLLISSMLLFFVKFEVIEYIFLLLFIFWFIMMNLIRDILISLVFWTLGFSKIRVIVIFSFKWTFASSRILSYFTCFVTHFASITIEKVSIILCPFLISLIQSRICFYFGYGSGK